VTEENGSLPERYGVRLADGTYRTLASDGWTSEDWAQTIQARAEQKAFVRVRSEGDGIESWVRADQVVEVLDQVPDLSPSAG
jgi:hypothetical protein